MRKRPRSYFSVLVRLFELALGELTILYGKRLVLCRRFRRDLKRLRLFDELFQAHFGRVGLRGHQTVRPRHQNASKQNAFRERTI